MRKLKLNVETLRRLDEPKLAAIRGGATIGGCMQSPGNSCPVSVCFVPCTVLTPVRNL